MEIGFVAADNRSVGRIGRCRRRRGVGGDAEQVFTLALQLLIQLVGNRALGETVVHMQAGSGLFLFAFFQRAEMGFKSLANAAERAVLVGLPPISGAGDLLGGMCRCRCRLSHAGAEQIHRSFRFRPIVQYRQACRRA